MIFDWAKKKRRLTVKNIVYPWMWLQKLTLLQRRVGAVLTWLNSESKTIWQAKSLVNQVVTVRKYVLVTIWCQVQYDEWFFKLFVFYTTYFTTVQVSEITAKYEEREIIYKYWTRVLYNIATEILKRWRGVFRTQSNI